MPVFEAEENAITRLAQREGRVAWSGWRSRRPARANPKATLLLNDFDLSPTYEHLIEDCLAAGVGIDALGLQTHMHQGYWGEEKTERILERFARFGLPLHLTETTLVSGDLMPPEIVDLNDYQIPSWPSTPEGEERQAEEIVRHYTHPVRSPGGPGDHVLGLHRRRRVARRARRGSCAPTALPSPPMKRWRPSSRASGGSVSPSREPTRRDGSRWTRTSATTR